MLEVNALPDNFCIAFQVFDRDELPLRLFCDALADEGVLCEMSGLLTRRLPKIQLP